MHQLGRLGDGSLEQAIYSACQGSQGIHNVMDSLIGANVGTTAKEDGCGVVVRGRKRKHDVSGARRVHTNCLGNVVQGSLPVGSKVK